MPIGQSAPQKPTARPGLINRLYLHPVRPAEQYQVHSAVWVEFADGRKRQFTGSTLCTAPKVFKDGRTFGWLEGAIEGRHGYLPATLVLFRDGTQLCKIEAEMRSTVNWCFSKDGQFAVIRSAALHGPTYFQRVNLMLRRVAARYTQFATATADPPWVSEAEQRMGAQLDGNYRMVTPLTLSPTQRRQWNETVSALAAVEMEPFAEGHLPDAAMIRFAVQHTFLNGGGLSVPAAKVDALCSRFFGKKPRTHLAVDTISFDGKTYRLGSEDAGEDSLFAVVDRVHQVLPGRYQVQVSEFRVTGDTQAYRNTPRDQWSRLGGETPTPTRQMAGLVRQGANLTVLEYLPTAWRFG